MKKILNFWNKKEKLAFVISFLGIVLFFGCGKDDKSVTSTSAPYPFNNSNITVDTTHLEAYPVSLTVGETADTTYSTTTTIVTLQWTVPSPKPTGYNVYGLLSGAGVSTSIGFVSGRKSPGEVVTIYDTSASSRGITYFYYVKSVFTLYDTTYNYYYSIESKPSPIVSWVKQ